MIRIIYTSFPAGGGIYLGLNPQNSGKIYRVDWDGDENDTAIEIADDIFEFISKVKEVPINSNDDNEYYKNRGENFWRIRE